MNKTTLIVIGVAVLVIGVLVGIYATKSNTLGGVYNNVFTQFQAGVQLGSPTEVGCLKIEDTDKGGYSYSTVLNGTMTTTGGSAATLNLNWTIPDACLGK